MKKKRKKQHRIRKICLGLLLSCFCILVGAGVFFGIRGYGLYREATAEESLEERIEKVRSIEHFTRYSEMPRFYRQAVISVEDHRFWEHYGIDPIAVTRAVWTNLKTMSFAEGGSTITQQLAKNLLFTQDKRIERKVAEVFAAFEIEAEYTKEEIFELYVNAAYFGSGYYGIYQAARGYFGKEPMELNDYESAMLAGIPNAPSAYSPDTSKEMAFRRVKQVLDSMVRHKIITREEAGRIERERVTFLQEYSGKWEYYCR